MKTSKFRERFWIRKDRENFFFSGLLLTSIVATITISYWNYSDMTEIKPKIKLDTNLSKEKQYKILKEADYIPPIIKSGTTSFYKIDEYAKPQLPPLPETGAQ